MKVKAERYERIKPWDCRCDYPLVLARTWPNRAPDCPSFERIMNETFDHTTMESEIPDSAPEPTPETAGLPLWSRFLWAFAVIKAVELLLYELFARNCKWPN